MIRCLCFLISQYQRLKKLLCLPRTCRFYPSCSTYALQSLQRHGFWKGSGYALWRLIRCSPLSAGGHDPVK